MAVRVGMSRCWLMMRGRERGWWRVHSYIPLRGLYDRRRRDLLPNSGANNGGGSARPMRSINDNNSRIPRRRRARLNRYPRYNRIRTPSTPTPRSTDSTIRRCRPSCGLERTPRTPRTRRHGNSRRSLRTAHTIRLFVCVPAVARGRWSTDEDRWVDYRRPALVRGLLATTLRWRERARIR